MKSCHHDASDSSRNQTKNNQIESLLKINWHLSIAEISESDRQHLYLTLNFFGTVPRFLGGIGNLKIYCKPKDFMSDLRLSAP